MKVTLKNNLNALIEKISDLYDGPICLYDVARMADIVPSQLYSWSRGTHFAPAWAWDALIELSNAVKIELAAVIGGGRRKRVFHVLHKGDL